MPLILVTEAKMLPVLRAAQCGHVAVVEELLKYITQQPSPSDLENLERSISIQTDPLLLECQRKCLLTIAAGDM